ncbi:MAG: cysteine--tRNA ligase [Dehalococcoidia bacterium]|nr:cysteine--tRNA ligase [Dehalococcoidia bacterium]
MKVTSTLSGKKEEFIPITDGEVKMYVCGITPQSEAHIGHAMSYINFDAIRRYLEYRGYKVRHIQNITDIEDKIINKAAVLGITPGELVAKNIAVFIADMDALNILRPHEYPRATEEIPQIIEMVRGLVEKGLAYSICGSVYFRVTRLPDYGKLARRTLDQMIAGARIEPGEEKEHPMDFVLWKAAKPSEPAWESPWGSGRPGWHIECSAMSLRYLGAQIDIHGGGQDLIFPHHENEIAQSESYTGQKPFVKYWLHNGLLRLGEEKMSKSLGNIVSIKDILSKYSADALRLFVLSSHYRSPLTFSAEALDGAEKGAERLRQALQAGCDSQGMTGGDLYNYHGRFIEAMDDDFNAPQAVAALFDLARDLNRLRDEGYNTAMGCELLRELGGVLGLTFQGMATDVGGAEPFIKLLLDTRRELRVAKQYALADDIRHRLEELGIALEDGPSGTIWKARLS